MENDNAVGSYCHAEGQITGVSQGRVGGRAACAGRNVQCAPGRSVPGHHGARGRNRDRACGYLGIRYTDNLTLIQLTVSDTRNLEQKKKLFRRIADHLAESPGLRREDIFINLVETKKENWSFGNGEAQYA